MQNIQVVCPVVRIESGNQRIGNGLECSICKREDEHAPSEKHVGVIWCGGREGHEGRQDVEGKRSDHQSAVADLVSDDAADDDSETKSREPCAADGAQLRGGETEFLPPIIENAAANGEANAGGENGGESSPEKPAGVWCNTFSFC